jgi:hypothetical protein
MYLLLVYLIMLSVAQNILHQMQKVSEMMWKEVVCPNLRNSSGICLHKMRYTKRNVSQESRSLGQGWSPGALEYYARVLPVLTAVFGQGI